MSKLKSKRMFLSPKVDSWVRLYVPKDKFDFEYSTTLADCDRKITWYFGANKADLAKLKKVRDLFDALYIEIEEKVNNDRK